MRWLIVLIPVLAALLFAGWVLDLEDLLLTRRTSDPTASPDDGAIGAPALRGLDPRARAASKRGALRADDASHDPPLDGAPGSLNGRVTLEGGVALSRLIVWQAPKRSMDPAEIALIEWPSAYGRPGLDGRFTLNAVRRPDTWIAIRVPGWRTRFLDGAEIDWDAWLEIELSAPLALTVTVLDREGAPMASEVLRAVPRGRRERIVPHGGPDDALLLQTQIQVTDEHGIARFELERDVTVDVSVVDRLTEPIALALSSEAPEGTFREAAPAKLFLDVLDAGTGKHLEEHLRLVFYDATGRLLDFELRTDDSADEIETELPLPPGRYLIEVRPRLRPAVLVDFAFDRYGVDIRRQVRVPVERDAAAVTVTRVDEASLDGAWWMLGRRDGWWSVQGWQRHRVGIHGPTLQLEPGLWSVVLALPASGDVCVFPTMALEPGQSARFDLSPRPGEVFALYQVLPADLDVRALAVEVQGMGRFEAVGRTARGTLLTGEDDVLRAIDAPGSGVRKDATAGPVLGPYPEGVTVVVRDAHGVEHRLPVR